MYEMKNVILNIAFLIYGLKGIAQNQVKDIELDSLCSSLENTIAKYKLDYSYVGEVYMIISDVRNEKIENSYILSSKNNLFDTIKITGEHQKLFESKMIRFANGKNVTIIAPFIYIENPKIGPNSNVMYYDILFKKIFEEIYKITKIKNQNIVLPPSTNIKRKVAAS